MTAPGKDLVIGVVPCRHRRHRAIPVSGALHHHADDAALHLRHRGDPVEPGPWGRRYLLPGTDGAVCLRRLCHRDARPLSRLVAVGSDAGRRHDRGCRRTPDRPCLPEAQGTLCCPADPGDRPGRLSRHHHRYRLFHQDGDAMRALHRWRQRVAALRGSRPEGMAWP